MRKETVNWIMKNSNVFQSPITRDTLLIADADTKVKIRVPKLLLECSMLQLHNDLIASPDDGGLLGSRHAKTNDVIISDTKQIRMKLKQFRIYLNVAGQVHIVNKRHNLQNVDI